MQEELKTIRHERIPELVAEIAELRAENRPRYEMFPIRERLQNERNSVRDFVRLKLMIKVDIQNLRKRIRNLQ